MIMDIETQARQNEFGALVGIDRTHVSQFVVNGILRPNGTYREWIMDFCSHLRARAAGRGVDDEDRKRRECAEADILQMKAQRMAGELIDRAGHDRAAYAVGRILQKALIDTLPSKISTELASQTDSWAIECYLRDKIRAELAAIASLKPEEIANEAA
jgi:hypothetical protein